LGDVVNGAFLGNSQTAVCKPVGDAVNGAFGENPKQQFASRSVFSNRAIWFFNREDLEILKRFGSKFGLEGD